jgi:hypothetical protein
MQRPCIIATSARRSGINEEKIFDQRSPDRIPEGRIDAAIRAWPTGIVVSALYHPDSLAQDSGDAIRINSCIF